MRHHFPPMSEEELTELEGFGDLYNNAEGQRLIIEIRNSRDRISELETKLATVRAYAMNRVQSHDVDVYNTAKGVLDIVGVEGPLASPEADDGSG